MVLRSDTEEKESTRSEKGSEKEHGKTHLRFEFAIVLLALMSDVQIVTVAAVNDPDEISKSGGDGC
jgi:hypothetical protein